MSAHATGDLAATAAAVRADLAERGVGFGGGHDRSPFVVDPLPRVISANEWRPLRDGLAQRGRALAAFVADAYGDRAVVAAGAVPERVIETACHYEPDMRGALASDFAWVAGLDLVCDGDGQGARRFQVLEDNLRTPSGIAYALAARAAVDAHLPAPPPPDRLDPTAALAQLGAALRAAAPADSGDEPAVALLSDGPSNSAWYEHRELAARLGLALLRPDDLLSRDGRLLGRGSDGSARPIDVLYRRTDEDRLRHRDGSPTWLGELLAEPLAAGTLAVVNPFGAGVADDKAVHAYVEGMIRFYLGEEPLLASVRSYDLGDADVLAEVLPRLDELVVKPRFGHGGEGVEVLPRDGPSAREEVRRRVAAEPERYVAQEVVDLSTEPTVCDGGRVEPRHVDLRPFVIGVGGHAVAAPVALTRVALARGSLIVNSSRDGGAKDTWLLR